MPYTKGPWIAISEKQHNRKPYEHGWQFYVLGGKIRHRIAKVDGPSNLESLDELNANAALIAAAPELLEALREILKDHEERVQTYPNMEIQPNRQRVMGLARAAIAKAEGRG